MDQQRRGDYPCNPLSVGRSARTFLPALLVPEESITVNHRRGDLFSASSAFLVAEVCSKGHTGLLCSAGFGKVRHARPTGVRCHPPCLLAGSVWARSNVTHA